jgi:hypothetical protein
MENNESTLSATEYSVQLEDYLNRGSLEEQAFKKGYIHLWPESCSITKYSPEPPLQPEECVEKIEQTFPECKAGILTERDRGSQRTNTYVQQTL